MPFGGSHLRLPSGPAGIRTTTGSLSALAGDHRYTEPSGRLLCVGFCVVVDDVDYVQVLHQFSFVTLNSRQPRVLIRNLLKPPLKPLLKPFSSSLEATSQAPQASFKPF